MFEKLTKEYEKHDLAREGVIRVSRDVIRTSKKIISAVHNNKLGEADKYKQKILKEIALMRKQKEFAKTGSYSIAIQEYIEAILLLEYAKTGKILGFSNFSCTPDEYIMGICDFVGELQRRSVLKVSKGDKKEIKNIYTDVRKIYDGLLDFSFRGEVRKKFDLVKYVMIRLEEIQLELKLRK